MFKNLFKLAFVGTFAGSIVLCFTLYNSGVRTVVDVQKKYNEVTNVVTELLTDAKLIRPNTYDFDILSVTNKIALNSTLKVANLSSEQKIFVHQTGPRDTWIIGGLLKGNAYFNFKASFTGSVEYPTKGILIAQDGKTIYVTLTPAQIFLSDIKYVETGTTGNLNDITTAKENLLDTFDSSAHNFNYSLYFNDQDTKDLLSKTANQADETIKDFILSIIKATNPGVDYEIVINRSLDPISKVTIQDGSGIDKEIMLNQIMSATSEAIITKLKSNDSTAQVIIQSVNNTTTPTSTKPIVKD